MERVYNRINWENEPSILTPLNATNLNKIDSAVYTIDGRVVGFDTTKAEQSDLLQCVKLINYDTSTGIFTFTWQNGTTQTVDLNIEKIPVTFTMDEHGVITMTTADGTQYTADVGALIKTYTFNDSSVIDFTVTTDASGNKIVTADIIDGTIDGTKLVPNYLADCLSAKNGAETAEDNAEIERLKSEGFAVGEQDGVPVTSGSPYYHNNAKYYSEQANVTSLVSLTDVDINNPQDKQALVYDTVSGKWINGQGGSVIDELNDIGDVNITNPSDRQALVYDNGEWVNGSGGLLPRMVIQTEVGSTVTITNGSESITAEAQGMGIYFAEIPDFDDWEVTATNGGQTSTQIVTVDTVKIYSVNASYFTAYINVTAPTGSTVTVVNGAETYTQTSGYNFTVHSSGTWTVMCTKADASKSASVSITSDGQTATATFEFASITVNYATEFAGATITATDGTHTYTRVASGTVVFDVADFGTWTISATVSGQTFSTSVVVSANTSYTVSLVMASYRGWLDSAGITTQYASLAEVLADEKTVRTLFTKFASVDYLVGWAQVDNASATTILNNDYCAKWINLRDYALDTLYADTTCSALMDSADKYFYGEWVEKDGTWQAKGNVPIMTNNSTPYGVASAYQVFDGNASTSASGTDFSYQFVNPISIKKFESDVADGTLQVSDNGTTWITNDNGYHLHARVHYASSKTVHTIQFYGRELKVSVPTMTGNTSPWGEAFGENNVNSSQYYSAFSSDDVFNSLDVSNGKCGYDFGGATIVKLLKLKNRTVTGDYVNAIEKGMLQGSNDNTIWENVEEFTNPSGASGVISYLPITNTTPYRYYRVACETKYSSRENKIDLHYNMYGLDYSEHTERHWIYDHGVEVEEVETNMGGASAPIGTATKYGDNITLYRNGSSNTAWQEMVTTNAIDCTPYKLLRAVCLNLQSTLSSRYGTIGVVNTKSARAANGVATSDVYNNIPRHINIDVSNVNAQIYPKIDLYIANTSSYMQNLEINEMWLE